MEQRNRADYLEMHEKYSENNGDHFFHKSKRIASPRAIQKTMVTTLQVKF